MSMLYGSVACAAESEYKNLAKMKSLYQISAHTLMEQEGLSAAYGASSRPAKPAHTTSADLAQ
eukprot:3129052-Pyramimonas_sp.AAC.1